MTMRYILFPTETFQWSVTKIQLYNLNVKEALFKFQLIGTDTLLNKF